VLFFLFHTEPFINVRSNHYIKYGVPPFCTTNPLCQGKQNYTAETPEVTVVIFTDEIECFFAENG
jgi:hypothetical protein